jgi:hypothetical protein
MMTEERRHEISKRIQFKRNLPEYLQELKPLIGREISPEDLTPVEQVEQIRAESIAALKGSNTTKFVIDFEERRSERFQDFVYALSNVNRSPVYIWTDRSDACGLYKAESIDKVEFSFPFDIDSNGLFTFLTEDFNDKLLLDFYEDAGKEILEIETTGKHWSLIRY